MNSIHGRWLIGKTITSPLLLVLLASCAEREYPIVENLGWDSTLSDMYAQFEAEAAAEGLFPRQPPVTAVFSDTMVQEYCPDDDGMVIGCCKYGFHFNNKLEAGVYLAEEMRDDPGLEVIAVHEFAHCAFGVDHNLIDATSIMYFAPDRSVEQDTGRPSAARRAELFEFIHNNRGF